MDLNMDFANILTLLLCLYCTFITNTIAQPLPDLDTLISTPIDNEFSGYKPSSEATKDSLLNRLKRGYYYIDNGEITPVNPKPFTQYIPAGGRRQDTEDPYQRNSIYTPLVHYNKSHAKHKKLFVPNFFG